MNEKDAQLLLDMLKQHCSFYQEYLKFLYGKLEIMANNHLEQLDAIVKEEEVSYLRVKGMERERVTYLEALGLQDKTFREIIPLFPESYQAEVKHVFEDFSDAVLDIKAVNLQCKAMAELRLHRIHTAIETLENGAASQKSQSTQTSHKFVSRKI